MHSSKQTFWLWKNPQADLNIHYEEKGSGDKHVLLIHGFASNTYTWRYTVDPLIEAGYHVWTIDLLGFGFSDKPLDSAYGPDLFLDQIHGFMDEMKIRKTHLIGNSMGGGVSLAFTLKFSERVKSLTLIDAMGHPMNLPFFLKFARWSPEIVKPMLTRTVIKTSLRDLIYNKDSLTEEQVDAYWHPLTLTGGKEAFLKVLQIFDNEILENMTRLFSKISVPTLIIWGDNDSLIPVSHAKMFHEEIKHSELLIIQKCGHLPQEEEPEVVNKVLLTFLNKC